MTIEWLAGNRLRGTTAERPNASLQSPSVGGWVEVGRTTLGSANASIDVSSLPDKRYYMVLNDLRNTSTNNGYYRIDNDSGSNYAARRSDNGGADGTDVNWTVGGWTGTTDNGTNQFGVTYLSNVATKEKLFQYWNVSEATAGASTAPNRSVGVSKHVQTTNPIDAFNIVNLSSTYKTNSETVVLGWDPADTHTSNFWEELASVELTSSGDQISSGTITAKKYLWIQVYVIPTGTVNSGIRFNSDQGSNYALRYSPNGASDATATSTSIGIESGSITIPNFVNMFTINNASNEKLGWLHGVLQNTAGAGTAPSRLEQAHKWANTSDQITQIDVDNFGAGSFDTGSILKVWGSD